MDLTILDAHGINSSKGLARCMNDPRFYQRLLGMFLKDDSFRRAKAACDAGDAAALFGCLHELKGACGNADMTSLYELVCPLLESLRGQSALPPGTKEAFADVEKAYITARRGVCLALGVEE